MKKLQVILLLLISSCSNGGSEDMERNRNKPDYNGSYQSEPILHTNAVYNSYPREGRNIFVNGINYQLHSNFINKRTVYYWTCDKTPEQGVIDSLNTLIK